MDNASPLGGRRGVVLVMVLVVVVLMSLAAYQYSESMTGEMKASDNNLRAAQARAFANSGIQYAAIMLSDPNNFTGVLNSNPYNNPQVFSMQTVQPNDVARLQGRFSLLGMLSLDDPGITGSQAYTFGVNDEAAKINLNALMQVDPSGQTLYNMLVLLPNMTPSLANAILDWLDPDDTPRDGGAESDTYSGLSPSYNAKNAPLDSLDELMMVSGMTWQLLFGNDRNKNGTLDLPDEDDGTGQHDRGFSGYLTIYSREVNVDSQGNPRIYVNSSDLNDLYTSLSNVLGQNLATYIMLYRMYGPSTAAATPAAGGKTAPTTGGKTGSSSAASMAGASSAASATPSAGSVNSFNRNSLNLGKSKAGTKITSLYSLINSSVTVPSSTGKGAGTKYPSPLNDAGQLQQLLPILLDECTTSQSTTIPGRINVNTAPSAVLSCLPNLTENDVQNIISMRPQSSSIEAPDPIFLTPAWLILEANISPTVLTNLDAYITTRAQVYRVQSIGYFDAGGPTARIEAVIDTNGGLPMLLYYRDLTELGKGFDFPITP